MSTTSTTIDPDFDTTLCEHEQCQPMLTGDAGPSSFYSSRHAICWGQLNLDGRAHVAYYIVERSISFIWNGVEPYVDVCLGGYGEPVYVRFAVEPTGAVNLAGFATACEQWAARHPQTNETNGAVA